MAVTDTTTEGRSPLLAARRGRGWRARPDIAVLVGLIAIGLLVRALAMALHATAVLDYYPGDSGRFVRAGYPGMFYDEWQPAGYALFLAAIRSAVDWLPVTIALQHLLGVAGALLLWAAARRAGAGRWAALVPAALVLLSAEHVFLEHTFLSEALWLPVLAAGVYAAVRALGERSLRWLAVASAVFGTAVVVRNVAMPLPAVLTLWAVLAFPAPARRDRLRVAASALLPAAGVVVAYVLVAGAAGPYSGLGEMSGWSLYQRVGQFADCRSFEPPAGTAGLCDPRPPQERPGPFYWYFEAGSPARKAFPAMSPQDSDLAGRFARAAILAQPLDYARTVVKDVVRYVDPYAGFDRPFSGSPPEAMVFRAQPADPAGTLAFAERVRGTYDGVDGTPDPGATVLESYSRVVRPDGLVLLVLAVLGVLALLRGAPVQRRAAALCLGMATALLLVPPALSSYDARYTVPPAMLLMVAAALALGGRRGVQGAR